MKPKYIISLLCGCSCLLPVSLKAQEEAQARQDSIKGFNALDYTLQRRYIPVGRPASNADKGKNVSVAFMGGMSDVVKSTSPNMLNGGFAISKQVSTFNTYRLTFTGAYKEINGKKTGRAGIELSHLFNLSDYLGGYHEGSHVNLYTVAGIGGYKTKRTSEKSKYAAGVHVGLQFDYHITDHWDWFLEPKAYFFTDNVDLVKTARKYDLGWQVMTGFTYRFTKWPIQSISTSFPDDLFLEAAVGLQGDYSSQVRSIAGKKPGPSASLSIGKWFLPIGVRATLFGGYHNTANNARLVTKEGYAGGRMEAMLNMNTLFNPNVKDPRFEVNLAGGYELGIVGHRGASLGGKKKAWFKGVTGAVQGIYFVDSNVGITGELRYSPVKKSDVTAEAAQMKNLSLMFGVQYRRRDDVFKERAQKYHFEPYNFAFTALGYNYAVHGGLGLKNILKKNAGGAAGVGRWFDPFSGVRGSVEIQHHDKGLFPLHLSVDYMLNMTNMIAGYMPERIFDLNAFAGGVYTHNTYRNGNHWGLEGGLQQMFHINDTWGIYLEESGRLYKGQVVPDARTFTSRAFNIVLDARLGFTYRF